jgi:23S rRNA (adenine1618-N6)-methyltransferase
VTNLKAGHKTRRWAVAWSFGDLRPANAVARHGELVQAVLPAATEWTVPMSEASSVEELDEKVNSVLTDLDLEWHWRADLHIGVAFARENVWSRSARRKRKFQLQQEENAKTEHAKTEQPPPSKKAKKSKLDDGTEEATTEDDDESNESDSSSSSEEDDEPTALAVKIICTQNQVTIRWLRGTDFTLWESFCGMLKRSLGARESGGGKEKRDKMEE